jgi:hypothetical protein
MSKKSVFCIATSRVQAEQIVDRLKSANFSNNDISALFPDRTGTRDFAHEKSTKAPEGAAAAPEDAEAVYQLAAGLGQAGRRVEAEAAARRAKALGHPGAEALLQSLTRP